MYYVNIESNRSFARIDIYIVWRFEADFRAGRKTESYASQIGLIEFVIGVVISVAAIALIVFE